VRRVSLVDRTVTTIAGLPEGGFADGPAAAALFMPLGATVDPAGAIVVADGGNARLRRIAGGTVTTFAGTGRIGGRDGAADGADLAMPTDVVPLDDGDYAVADGGGSTIRIVRAVYVAPAPDPPPPPPPSAEPEAEATPPSGGCASAGGAVPLAMIALLLALSRRWPATRT
jgi:hypothetical protein